MNQAWVRFEGRQVDKITILHLLQTLISVSKCTRMYAASTVQFAMLCLASNEVDMDLVMISNHEKADKLLEVFDSTVEFFN